MKTVKLIAAVTVLIVMCCFGVYAQDSDAKLMCVARDGYAQPYAPSSAQGIAFCEENGVDAVSVGVQKSSDGVFFLMRYEELSLCCADASGLVGDKTAQELMSLRLLNADKSESEYSPSTLEAAIKETENIVFILDGAWQWRDEIYSLVSSCNALSRVTLRTQAKADEITAWYSQHSDMQLIGVYGGNIVFSAIAYAKALLSDGLDTVQYYSGNYFGVIFANITLKNFQGLGRALCATYDKTLCGQRNDSVQGWDDLVSRGYGAIETNRPLLLSEYVKAVEAERSQLRELLVGAKATKLSSYSSASSKAVSEAVEESEAVLSSLSSKGELEVAHSQLLKALAALVPGDASEKLKNNFNITPGKIIAIILGAASVIAAQVYVHKRQKKIS